MGPVSAAGSDATIGDLVWEDLNADGRHDAGEPGIAGFTVRLGGTESDGTKVDRVRETDAEAIDSDADIWSGITQVVTVDNDTRELSLNAGVVVDRAAAIVLDVSLPEATKVDDDRRSTIRYEHEISNAGSIEAPYDLANALRFGAGIEVLEARVESTGPGGIETSPDYDGASETTLVTGATISPGTRQHTHSVSVDAVVPESLAEDAAECLSSSTDVGSGFMSVVELSTTGETLTDRACVDAPIRRRRAMR